MALPVRRSGGSGSTATRWDPFSELDELQSRTSQLMENLWSGTAVGNGGIWVPAVDVEEAEDAWIVEAELPGVDKKDVNVDVQGNELIISGEIKERERKGILRRRTRRTGEFEYRVSLPGELSRDKVDASLDGGVLTVRVPKPERDRSQRIEVRAA